MTAVAPGHRQFVHQDGVGVALDMGPTCLIVDGCALTPDQAHDLAVILLEWSWTK